MFINRAAAYALKVMICMAKKASKYKDKGKQQFFSQELAKECNIPHHYLSKVLRQLVRTNILYAAPGQKGGYRFKKKPSSIFLYKIIEPFIDVGIFNKCFFGMPFCGTFGSVSSVTECPLYSILRKTTLSQFVEKYFGDGKICQAIFKKTKEMFEENKKKAG